MEDCKNIFVTFEHVLRYIYEETGEIHYSFCSKLLATLDPDSPILDQYVLRHSGFALMGPEYSADARIKYYTNVYYTIKSEYEMALSNSEMIKKFIKTFNTEFPDYAHISDYKKMDSLLYSKFNERTTPYLKEVQYFEIIMSNIKRNDVPFEKWVQEVKTASALPVTAGLHMAIYEELSWIEPYILKFLIECFEQGMTPLEAVIEWA